MKTSGQKAYASLNARFMIEAEVLSSAQGMLVKDAFAIIRKAHYAKGIAKRRITQAKNKSVTQTPATQTPVTEVPVTEAPVTKNLTHIATNPSKQLIYCLLGFEALTLNGPMHAITMPSQNTDFEFHLHKQNENVTFTFIERNQEIARTIAKNFQNIPHSLHVGNYPEKTQSVRADYHKSNFVWLDFMGCFLQRYYDEIELLMQSCLRNEMIFAVTIGSRGSSKETDKPYDVSQKLRTIFMNHGWNVDRMTINQYKSTNNVAMHCISYRLVNSANKNMDMDKIKHVAELTEQITTLQMELAELNDKRKRPAKSPQTKTWETRKALANVEQEKTNDTALTPCEKAWITRRRNKIWKKRAIELYQKGLPYKEIAKEVGVGYNAVYMCIRNKDLPQKTSKENKALFSARSKKAWETRRKRGHAYGSFDLERAKKMRKKGCTFKHIAQKMNRAPQTVSYHLNK